MIDLRPILKELTKPGPNGEPSQLGEPRVIWDRVGGSEYLSRWYPVGHRADDDEKPSQFSDQVAPKSVAKIADERTWNLFLHRFHRSDDDGALHSHPWEWSFAFVLVGGYSEERRVKHGDEWTIERRMVLPFTFNFLSGSDYHRVDLIEEDAWTIFVAGPKLPTWFFWDRDTNLRAQWEDFIKWRRGVSSDASWQTTPDRSLASVVQHVAKRVLGLDAMLKRFQ